ncbi:type VI secretion system-associated protein TagF [Tropicimonas sp. IMCC6043]|uniref:type VI secretion system-associated protein TagF n=1 Tax=Tropicimonas sp. IMCC6043 TaxID=2510645 RepID=UPI00101DE8F3|nr:type VI secretion system-associated protein TagF [Tropicimonas sp. IMCC6043]RYH09357.1 type VI secretion system-associated protein TagF [Tropicimonas sp. IMCC6043]
MSDVVLMAGNDLLGPVGAFGKMPSQGDFFWIDLPQGFAPIWDRWLSGAVQAARERLGERWQECYYSAPIWRFTLAPGEAGAQALMGVLMPSVDRVGRAFPLTLVAPVAPASFAARGHMASSAAFQAFEAVALDALEFEMTQDNLRARLADLRAGLLLLDEDPAPGVPEAFDIVRPRVYWSAVVDGRTEYLATTGLPNARELMAMFDLADPYWAREAAE